MPCSSCPRASARLDGIRCARVDCTGTAANVDALHIYNVANVTDRERPSDVIALADTSPRWRDPLNAKPEPLRQRGLRHATRGDALHGSDDLRFVRIQVIAVQAEKDRAAGKEDI